MERLMGFAGLATMLALAYLFSANRRAIRLKTVVVGLGLQFVFALFVLRTDTGRALFATLGAVVTRFLHLSWEGSRFIFGQLGVPDSAFATSYGSVFGMGQTETPLTIRPYLNKLTESELMTVMTSGFAHIAGGVMAAYILFGAEARHLLTALVMTAPGTILLAKMFVPETGKPQTAGVVKVEIERPDPNVLGAAARGTTDGLYLALNVAAMLVAFLALIAFVNWVLGGAHDTLAWLGFAYFPASLEQILGWVFSPVAWLLGVPWSEATTVGNLLGLRMVTNEFIAFGQLGEMIQAGSLSARSITITTFALCGFANFSSIGIQIGGIGALAPNKRDELAKLGIRAMLAGTMANLMSASIVGMLI